MTLIDSLSFVYPRSGLLWSSGRAGDMFILMKASCQDAQAISPDHFFIGKTFSARATLEDLQDPYNMGGVARATSINEGKLNELDQGMYKVLGLHLIRSCKITNMSFILATCT